jgi:hypothetical protein
VHNPQSLTQSWNGDEAAIFVFDHFLLEAKTVLMLRIVHKDFKVLFFSEVISLQCSELCRRITRILCCILCTTYCSHRRDNIPSHGANRHMGVTWVTSMLRRSAMPMLLMVTNKDSMISRTVSMTDLFVPTASLSKS